MSRHVAFLRAVNVAGHGRAKMSDVRDVFSDAGGASVSTYIQTGNVIFEAPTRDAPKVVSHAARGLHELLGEAPMIMLRPMQRLIDLVEHPPFVCDQVTEPVKHYVVFLSQEPGREPELPLVSAAEALETIGIEDREVFLISRRKRNGFFGFPNNFIESELGVSATSRNWSTITKLVEKFGMDDG